MKPRQMPVIHFEPPEAEIRRCAYFLWQKEGSPAGRDLDLWLRARELLRQPAKAEPSRAVPRRALTHSTR